MSLKIKAFRNGFGTDYLLDRNIEEKIKRYGSCALNTHINDLFSFSEFEQVFLVVHMQFTFSYNGIMFTLFNWGNNAEFWIDGDDKKSYKKYEDPKQLLKEVKVDDKYLNEIWDNIVIAC